jgi:hypothetical protein
MLAVFAVASVAAFERSAHAQFGGQPGGMQPGGMGPQMGEEPKEEGPAEEAPEEEQQSQDLEPLGAYAGQSRRTTQVVQIDGLHALAHGLHAQAALGQSYITGATNTGGTGGHHRGGHQLYSHTAVPRAAGVPDRAGPLQLPRIWAAGTCAFAWNPPSTSATRFA